MADVKLQLDLVDVYGKPLGENQILTLSAWNAESPSLVEGERTLGMAFNMGPAKIGRAHV